MGFLRFVKNDESMYTVYLIQLVTLLVVFQCDLRYIRDGAWEEWNIANFERNPTPFGSIFNKKRLRKRCFSILERPKSFLKRLKTQDR